ncbi:potassium channel family protein [Pseudonocardia xishanensis]|uniref:Potassium channel family protein n=1 Tax=Pseudonocardia xishanensis TaxID=630995 RepID=A0ABP8S157_9PSEU
MGRREITRTVVSVGLVLAAYYLAPYGEHVTAGDAWLRGGLLALAIVVLVVLVGRRVEHEVRTEGPSRTGPLLVALVAGVVIFALADLVVATTMPGQFEDLRTKTDALYFSLTTLTTVGYGDVHAEGQVARALVVAQLVFDVVVLATAARNLVGAARRHRAAEESLDRPSESRRDARR